MTQKHTNSPPKVIRGRPSLPLSLLSALFWTLISSFKVKSKFLLVPRHRGQLQVHSDAPEGESENVWEEGGLQDTVLAFTSSTSLAQGGDGRWDRPPGRDPRPFGGGEGDRMRRRGRKWRLSIIEMRTVSLGWSLTSISEVDRQAGKITTGSLG